MTSPKLPWMVTGGVGIAGYPSLSFGGQIVPGFPDSPVDFDPQAFDALLSDKGYLVTWEKAAYCPNRPRGGVAPATHDINCRICDGTGFVYFGGCDTEMLIQAVTLHQNYWAQGRWDLGMVRITARPGIALSYGDRVSLRNGAIRFSELVVRGTGASDKLKYEPLDIDYVAWVNRSGSLVTFGVGSDLDVQNGSAVWIGSGPDSGAYYTITYTCRPRYVVQDLLHQHRESSVGTARVPFPTQAVGKLDFLVRDESRDAAQVVDRDPFQFGGP